jgi:beta-phosphoglucomutase
MAETKAFLFDLNGTMIDDMDFHIHAWHKILTNLGAELSLDEVKKECYGKNDELLERIFPGRFSEDEMLTMSYAKEKTYQEAFKPLLKLINGLDVFLEKSAEKNIRMGIGSAAIHFNIDFVLDGLSVRHYFKSIVGAEDVVMSKPDPETYTKCADELGVAYENCIVFEDAPKGVEAAANAGMQCVVITTMHTKEEFDHYTDPQLDKLFH